MALTGGMKTCSRPSRGSTHSAVRTMPVGGVAGPRRDLLDDRRGPRRGPAATRRCVAGSDRRCAVTAARRQRRPVDERIGLVDVRIVARARPTAANRAAADSPSANRRESGTGARGAGTTGRSSQPARVRRRRVPPQRQHVADRRCSSPCSKMRASRARSSSSFSSRLQRIDVGRQPPLPPEVVPDVLVAGMHACRRRRRAARPARSTNRCAVAVAVAVVDRLVGDQPVVVPDRLAVAAPVAAERPARQRLARIPLALAEVQQSRPARTAAFSRRSSSPASSRLRGPSAAVFHSSPSMSSIETNVGSPPIVSRTSPRRSSASTRVAERVDRPPLLLGVRLGDARRLVDPRARPSRARTSTRTRRRRR